MSILHTPLKTRTRKSLFQIPLRRPGGRRDGPLVSRKAESLDSPAREQAANLLLEWYRRARRRLPWRDSPSPYAVWVSEVMLQQTRVETVVPFYLRFLGRFPTIRDLALADIDLVLALWSGLGYYRRARSLHAGAREVLARHGGEFPRDLESALEIPGVGPYTAGAVLSIAYNLPAPVVDGNVERVLTRLLRIPGDPRGGALARRLRVIEAGFIPEGHASEFNQAVMELGATLCAPREPACPASPLAEICLARRHGDASRYPESARRPTSVPVMLHAALVRNGERCLIERVTRRGYLEGLWLFPFIEADGARESARMNPSPTPDPRLADSLSRKLGVRLRAAGLATRVRHAITFRRITVEVYRFEPRAPFHTHGGDGPLGGAAGGLRWSRLEELGKTLAVSSIVPKVLKSLGKELVNGEQKTGNGK
ncbi:MAG TPA: A/G-specific adenine glycosylase [Planctomycetota bacterium]|nr:A/G-specific adenine glycosylase [Planctomycetota bacterium]